VQKLSLSLWVNAAQILNQKGLHDIKNMTLYLVSFPICSSLFAFGQAKRKQILHFVKLGYIFYA